MCDYNKILKDKICSYRLRFRFLRRKREYSLPVRLDRFTFGWFYLLLVEFYFPFAVFFHLFILCSRDTRVGQDGRESPSPRLCPQKKCATYH